VNVKELRSNEEPIGQRVTTSVSNKLKRRKRKNTYPGYESSIEAKKSTIMSPARAWSKVSIPIIKKRTSKRKEVLDSDYDYEVEQDVMDIVPP